MKRLFSAKPFVAAALAFGALGVASAAHARSDVFFSIGIPGAYVQSAPVYVQPQPVYVQPQSIYYGRGFDERTIVYERDHRRHWRDAHRHGPYGDFDRDGVPNRFDNFPNNPHRR